MAEADALAAECQAARSEVRVREAQLAVVSANLARTRLYAPFDGIIAEINGERYEYVTPSPLGSPPHRSSTSSHRAVFMSSPPLTKWMWPAFGGHARTHHHGCLRQSGL
ncbi:hypothetical protein [Desulfosarcina cetonica]|uniref:hypothetical protein n=1 Tax=Desulfosarcina cetonica TaxID=90730 RepID=UPI001C45C8A5